METTQLHSVDNQRLIENYKRFLADRQKKRVATETPERNVQIEEAILLLKQENARRGTTMTSLHI
jgi:hypothetical protein